MLYEDSDDAPGFETQIKEAPCTVQLHQVGNDEGYTATGVTVFDENRLTVFQLGDTDPQVPQAAVDKDEFWVTDEPLDERYPELKKEYPEVWGLLHFFLHKALDNKISGLRE